MMRSATSSGESRVRSPLCSTQGMAFCTSALHARSTSQDTESRGRPKAFATSQWDAPMPSKAERTMMDRPSGRFGLSLARLAGAGSGTDAARIAGGYFTVPFVRVGDPEDFDVRTSPAGAVYTTTTGHQEMLLSFFGPSEVAANYLRVIRLDTLPEFAAVARDEDEFLAACVRPYLEGCRSPGTGSLLRCPPPVPRTGHGRAFVLDRRPRRLPHLGR